VESSWNDLHSRYEMRRINHEEAYSLDGAYTNDAKSFFSRMRRAEIGHHHHVAGAYCCATGRKRRGARITAASRTARRCGACPGWRSRAASRWILLATGSVISKHGRVRGHFAGHLVEMANPTFLPKLTPGGRSAIVIGEAFAAYAVPFRILLILVAPAHVTAPLIKRQASMPDSAL
jgi:hypothetical protein